MKTERLPGHVVRAVARSLVVVGLAQAWGCRVPVETSPTAVVEGQAVLAVVTDAYGRLGDPAAVYLGVEGLDPGTAVQLRATLEDEFTSDFRSPPARASGDPGASIALGRFRADDVGQLRVTVSFVTVDGSVRGCFEYLIARVDAEWSIAETTDAAATCPISEQGTESYHEAIARVRSNECTDKWSNIGTCGPWLYVAELTGYGGTASYYDTTTGLIVGHEILPDDAGTPGRFDLGSVECPPDVTETIPCLRE